MALMIAYSPTLLLKESFVALYKIYILKNPLRGDVFYVGQTLQDLETRLNGHIHESGDVNPEKNQYIKEIIRKGSRPTIEAIETISGTCRIDKALVNNREIHWIKYYKSIGVRLLNIASTSHDAESREYKDYLRAIKQGEADYRYYYCGRTYGGHEVYDEQKMHADGFTLPPQQSSIVKIIEKERVVERFVEKTRYVFTNVPMAAQLYPDLPQPDWSPEFLASLPEESYPLEDSDITDYDAMEADDSDYEPDSDAEPDYEGEDEELESDDYVEEDYDKNVIYADRGVPFYISKEL